MFDSLIRPTLAIFTVDSNFDLCIFCYVNEFLYPVSCAGSQSED